MRKMILGIAATTAILGLANIAHSTYVVWDSAINPDNGHTYYIFYSPISNDWPFLSWDHANDISWLDANNAAEAMGGYLATITSEAEESFLQSNSAFAGSVKGEGIRAWIGLSDRDSEGNFKWITGPESGQVLTFADWMGGEPNNAWPDEDYVEWRNYPYGPSGGSWNDVPGNAVGVNTFMVEVNPVPEPATLLLFGSGIAGLACIARKKRS